MSRGDTSGPSRTPCSLRPYKAGWLEHLLAIQQAREQGKIALRPR